ncbi:MAG TPA: PIN domain-containing protein [Thermoanaerobaculia bacterium]|nr:PIN domain-containing protein [Thermoanaerobaculia bacterium]
MIVLDTNVISALMRREPDPNVVAWLDGLPAESIWTTSITVFEVRLGLEILEAGRPRLQVEEAFDRALEEDFEGRVLPFDVAAAQAASPLTDIVPAVPSKFATSRLPVSPRRAGQPWRPATLVTSRDVAWRWSILGPSSICKSTKASPATPP